MLGVLAVAHLYASIMQISRPRAVPFTVGLPVQCRCLRVLRGSSPAGLYAGHALRLHGLTAMSGAC